MNRAEGYIVAQQGEALKFELSNILIRSFLVISFTAAAMTAQVPANIESELVKMGHIVDPPCTAKLYRPLMPANDITSGAKPVYPGITVVRDASFQS